MNRLLKLLGRSEDSYQMLLLSHYTIWCNLNSDGDKEAQLLLISPTLFRWWLDEYRVLENNFLEASKDFNKVYNKWQKGKSHQQIFNEMYTSFVLKIGRFYPKAILDEIKKGANSGTEKTDYQYRTILN